MRCLLAAAAYRTQAETRGFVTSRIELRGQLRVIVYRFVGLQAHIGVTGTAGFHLVYI